MMFNGMGIIGHDNVKGEYISTWIDNLNTSMMQSNGRYDAATKTITENGQFFCPMKNAAVKAESQLRFVDADHLTYTMYDITGEKYTSMEIKYTRSKSK